MVFLGSDLFSWLSLDEKSMLILAIMHNDAGCVKEERMEASGRLDNPSKQ